MKSPLFWAVVLLLAAGQTAALFLEPHPAWVVVALATDAALLWAALPRLRSRDREQEQRVQDALRAILERVRTQLARWIDRVESLAGQDPEDRELFAKLQRLLASREELKAHPPVQESAAALVDAVQTMVLLSEALSSDFDEVLNSCQASSEGLRRYRRENRLGHFRLREAVSFLSDMGAESKQYSETLVLEVLASFQEITRFNQEIDAQVRGQLAPLMDPSNPLGLGTVRQQSGAIQSSVDELSREVERVDAASELAVKDTVTQMKRVQDIAQAIEDFSESIRMISLNLGIEAARSQGGSGSAKAVQVLATKLAEFAVKAQELAAQQQAIVGTAARVLAQNGAGQRRQFLDLIARVRPLNALLQPFPTIVGRTFEAFAEVERTMGSLASAVEKRLEDAIGKFQFQDLVRQEQEHVLALVAYVRDRMAESGEGLAAEDERAAKQDLVDTFERLASTENEHRIIRAYRRASGLPVADRAEVSAGSVELF